jgi:serine/threonine-protein kinase
LAGLAPRRQRFFQRFDSSPQAPHGCYLLICLVFCSQSRLFTRRLDQAKATELTGTEGAFAPFFSPDGQWVAFFAQGKLKKTPVQGGTAIPLCNAPLGAGGSWGTDGNIIATLSSYAPLSRIPEAGGAPTQVADLAPGDISYRWPQILPGGKAVLLTAITPSGTSDRANIAVMSLNDRRLKELQRGGVYGRYVPGGHLIYIHDGTLFAVPFDLGRLEISGTPVPVLQEVSYSGRYGYAQLDFSQSGTLLHRSGAGIDVVTVQWVDAAGGTRPILAKPDDYGTPRLSPDGNRLALSLGGDVWTYDTRRETMTRLTQLGSANFPVWTPDGRYIVFRSARGIHWTRSDGSAKPQTLTKSANLQFPTFFTPDGKRLAFSEMNREGAFNIWTVPVQSEGEGLRAGKPEPYLQTSFDARNSHLSPDGRWIAYSSEESGTTQVYVRAFPDKGNKWQISNGGGTIPIFSLSGRELFFRDPNNQVMVAAYTVQGDSFVAEKPRMWSVKTLADVGLLPSYDLAPDGKSIVALVPVESPEAQRARNHVIFLFNFFDELRRKAPVK